MNINDDLTVTLMDVFELERKAGVYPSFGRNFSALSMRLSGGATFTYKHGKVSLKKNTITLVPANVDYTARTSGEGMFVVHFNLCNFATDEIQSFTPDDPEEFQELFLKLLTVWEKKTPGYKLEATAVFYEILSKIKRQSYQNDMADNRCRFAAEYMRRHMSDPELSIHSVAQKICVCDTLLRREFNKEFGMSPKQYLTGLRIEYAIMLLQSEYFSQKEICEKCGYSDISYFRTAFKKKTGISLSKYKYNYYKSPADSK